MSAPVRGTEGYADDAARLTGLYESLSFGDVHGDVATLLPSAPARILDVGAGTGRDAAALAAMGHQVAAVEPLAEFRAAAQRLHAGAAIEWIDDSLPGLERLRDRAGEFDAILLTAVWMHLDADERARAMPYVAQLLRPGGVLLFSLRHGPVPAGRRMFDTSAEETAALASREGLISILRVDNRPSRLAAPGVTWTRVAFRKPDKA